MSEPPVQAALLTAPPPASVTTPAPPAEPQSPWPRLALWLVALAALALAGWSYLTRGKEADRIAQEAVRNITQAQTLSREAQVAARNAQDAARDAITKLQALETRLAESQNQQLALERLYEDLSRSKDEWVLIEIERTVELAAQQLQVAGNVNGAIAALQTADTRLARADKPQYAGIRKIILRDIEHLRAMPAADITGLALKLSALADQVDELPLLSDPVPTAFREGSSAVRAYENLPWYSRAWTDIKDEIGSLVRIRKLDANQTLLLSAEQGRTVRDALKLKLLQARLALLGRNPVLLANDLNSVELTVKKHFDPAAASTKSFLATVRQIAAAPVVLEYPTLNETLTAIAAASGTAGAKPAR